MLKPNIASTILTFLVCYCTSQIALAQSYYFKEYNVSDGMPFVQVETIVQDKNGYLWTGGYGGLSQFDGKNFINYSKLDGLVSTTINQLSVDTSGILWIATPKGLNYYHNDSIKNFSTINSTVHQLTPYTHGIFAILDTCVAIIRKGVLEKTIPLHQSYTNGSFAYWNDTLWYGTKKGFHTPLTPTTNLSHTLIGRINTYITYQATTTHY